MLKVDTMTDLLKPRSITRYVHKVQLCAKGTTDLLKASSVTRYMHKVQLCAKGTTDLLKAW